MPKLDDPGELQIIKQVYFGEGKKSEEAEREQTRNKKAVNQSR